MIDTILPNRLNENITKLEGGEPAGIPIGDGEKQRLHRHPRPRPTSIIHGTTVLRAAHRPSRGRGGLVPSGQNIRAECAGTMCVIDRGVLHGRDTLGRGPYGWVEQWTTVPRSEGLRWSTSVKQSPGLHSACSSCGVMQSHAPFGGQSGAECAAIAVLDEWPRRGGHGEVVTRKISPASRRKAQHGAPGNPMPKVAHTRRVFVHGSASISGGDRWRSVGRRQTHRRRFLAPSLRCNGADVGHNLGNGHMLSSPLLQLTLRHGLQSGGVSVAVHQELMERAGEAPAQSHMQSRER